ncbi:MAG: YybH family protein [Xanthobacteraceae bacterium]
MDAIDMEMTMIRSRRFVACAIAMLIASAALPAAAFDDTSRGEIAAALAQWTADFNAGRADKVCDLFAHDLRADFRGQPERGFDAQCDLLKRSLADPSRSFSYALAVKEILVWGEVAVVRLTWTLTVRQKDSGREISSIEPGLDVFRRQSDGRWRIVRYIAYEQ